MLGSLVEYTSVKKCGRDAICSFLLFHGIHWFLVCLRNCLVYNHILPWWSWGGPLTWQTRGIWMDSLCVEHTEFCVRVSLQCRNTTHNRVRWKDDFWGVSRSNFHHELSVNNCYIQLSSWRGNNNLFFFLCQPFKLNFLNVKNYPRCRCLKLLQIKCIN